MACDPCNLVADGPWLEEVGNHSDGQADAAASATRTRITSETVEMFGDLRHVAAAWLSSATWAKRMRNVG
jgi:hypothetical protein